MSEKKYIHVNQGNIRGNLKTKRTGRDQELKPVITIKQGKENVYCNSDYPQETETIDNETTECRKSCMDMTNHYSHVVPVWSLRQLLRWR